MRMPGKARIILLASALLFPQLVPAQVINFKELQNQILGYKSWLDRFGAGGSRFWTRLDSSKRPHRLYVGEAFLNADDGEKEEFIEIFSRFLAGHPDKNMLIDIYDSSTNKYIGEYGFGGFRLFPTPR